MISAELYALAHEVGEEMVAGSWHLGTAESCTGGLIGGSLTAIPGSSEWFDGGIIVYTNAWKQRLLGVADETLKAHGAVSEQTVSEMLDGLRDRQGLTAGLAVSGIAGPGGGTPGKPVGTVVCGAFLGDLKMVVTHHFAGDRDSVRQQSVKACLEQLLNLARQMKKR